MGLAEIKNAVIDGEMDSIEELTRAEMAAGTPAQTILDEGFISAMDEVGRQFQCGDIYTPEMLLSAKTMKAGVAVLKPLLMESGVRAAGHVVIGTVKGDLHDIGKNLVSMMLEGAGFQVKDLGIDVPPDKFIKAIEPDTDIVAFSALLTTTMGAMKTTIDALKNAGVRDQVRIMIGGAPITDAFAAQIGADAYAPNASAAVQVAKNLAAKPAA
jgi:5-methyltetrahydrofolate--homocysteine methyltransferase